MENGKGISREQVTEVHARLVEMAQGIVELRECESILLALEPMEKKDGSFGLAPVQYGLYPLSDVSKIALPFFMQAMAKRYGLAVYLCEAWQVIRSEKEVQTQEYKPPSQCEDRVEVVVMFFVADGWRAQVSHPVTTVNGKRTLPDAAIVYEDKDTRFMGAMVGSTPERTVQ
jgi:hypothetical protein